jgi:hypothetical protein
MSRAVQLAEYLARHRDRAFEWHAWDCKQLCGEWLKEAAGVDHLSWIPPYADESGAREVIANGGSIAQIVCERLQQIHPSRALVGDLVLSPDPYALGICIGVQSAHVGRNGLVYRKTAEAAYAWRVPCPS